MHAGHRGSEIASEINNLCVCGTYQRIKSAVAGL
jgi:isoquinoline 1-oxidoreductase alpha subunit